MVTISNLPHVLNIMPQENSTFWGEIENKHKCQKLQPAYTRSIIQKLYNHCYNVLQRGASSKVASGTVDCGWWDILPLHLTVWHCTVTYQGCTSMMPPALPGSVLSPNSTQRSALEPIMLLWFFWIWDVTSWFCHLILAQNVQSFANGK